ncbi:hypothetical protein BDP27DRAFT_1435107 [Rhodocollybia butyracea]|uniref:Uncharacterized protein n=1 Tax=Rhodocollybia butyracea TaxID=206335 RepID=A0A9P5TWN8_9AGAR|nr:hypothetical protein BDP27DRAFT_1435107 [Rhodocollybia butyracea]
MTHPENESGPSSRANPTVTHPRLTAATKIRIAFNWPRPQLDAHTKRENNRRERRLRPTLEMDATSSSELSRFAAF